MPQRSADTRCPAPRRPVPPRGELPTVAELFLLAEEVCLAVGWMDLQPALAELPARR